MVEKCLACWTAVTSSCIGITSTPGTFRLVLLLLPCVSALFSHLLFRQEQFSKTFETSVSWLTLRQSYTQQHGEVKHCPAAARVCEVMKTAPHSCFGPTHY